MIKLLNKSFRKSYFYNLFFLLFLFLSFSFIEKDIAYSQGGDIGLEIRGRIGDFNFPYRDTPVPTNNTDAIPDANLNYITGITVRLYGPRDTISGVMPTNVRASVSTTTLSGYSGNTRFGWYNFPGLPRGEYELEIVSSGGFNSFYWNHETGNPANDNPIPMNGTITTRIPVNLDQQIYRMNNIYAKGIKRVFAGRVDSTGYYTGGYNYGRAIPNVSVMLTSPFYSYRHNPPKVDTFFTQTSSDDDLITSVNATSQNFVFDNPYIVNTYNGSWTFQIRKPVYTVYGSDSCVTAVTVTPTYSGFNYMSPSNATSLYTNWPSYTYSDNSNTERINLSYPFRAVISSGTFSGTIRFGSTTGPLLEALHVELRGPVDRQEVLTNINGAYSFDRTATGMRNFPTNSYYADYVIKPLSDIYDFSPDSVIFRGLNNTTTDAAGFTLQIPNTATTCIPRAGTGGYVANIIVATLKKKQISGTLYDGNLVVPGITVYISKLRDGTTNIWDLVETIKTDANGEFKYDGESLATYKITTLDQRTIGPTVPETLVFYPEEVIFEKIITAMHQDFYTASDRHYLHGRVLDVTDVPSGVAIKDIILEVRGTKPVEEPYFSSTTTDENGEYEFLVPNGDTYRISPKLTQGAVFNPILYDTLNSNTNIYGGNYSVKGLDFMVEFISPILVSPEDNSVLADKDVTFTWHKINDAQHYYVEYSTYVNFSEVLPTAFHTTTNGASDTTWSTTLPEYNTTYYWRVSTTKNSIVSPYSVVWSVTTGLDQPVLISPIDESEVFTLRPTLTWEATPGASKYTLILTQQDGTQVGTYPGLASTSWTPTNDLLDGVTYSWYIQAFNSAGVLSNTSVTWNFKALRAGYTISGIIEKENNYDPVQGAIVTLENYNNSPSLVTTTTNANGEYVFNNVPTASDIYIEVDLPGYTFELYPSLKPSPIGYTSQTINGLKEDYTLYFIAKPLKVIISGIVYDDNNNQIEGAFVDCNNGYSTTTAITDATGYYEFEVHSDSTYTINARDGNRVFNPLHYVFNYPIVDQSNKNFKSERNAFILSGKVVHVNKTTGGIDKVEMEIISSDDPGNSIYTTTNSNGEYQFTAFGDRDYTIRATKLGYTISSANTNVNTNGNPQKVTSVSSTTTIIDFIATPVSLTIEGNILDHDNHPLAGVELYVYINSNVAPNAPDMIISATATGTYIINNVTIDNTYRVVPYKSGTMFDPAQRVYNYPNSSLKNENYHSLSGGAFVVTGEVRDITNGLPGTLLGDVIIHYTSIHTGTSGFYMTQSATGTYTFPSNINDEFTVQATKEGYTITSTSGNPQTVGPIVDNTTASVFHAQKNYYTLSGIVTFEGQPLSGVVVYCDVFSGGTNASNHITGTDGRFTFTVEALGDYTIRPVLMGFKFNPTSYNIQRVLANRTNIDFNSMIGSIPRLLSPINGTIGVEINPTLVWESFDGAVSYNLQYSTTYNFSSNIMSVTNINGLTRQVSGLNSNTTYYWRINASLQGSNLSDWSETWSFRTAAGKIAWNPSYINFDTLVVGRGETKTVVITNEGGQSLELFSATIEGANKDQFSVQFTPIEIPSYGTYTINVTFTPTSVGAKNAILRISHNDISTQNPIEISLNGFAILTKATLELPTILDFGSLIIDTDPVDQVIEVYNSSDVYADYLTIRNGGFDVATDLFEIVNVKAFPIVLSPGTVYNITIRFKPERLGLASVNLSLPNTSSNNPNPKVLIRGNVMQGDLIVLPTPIDFGNSTKDNPRKDTILSIQNNSTRPINIDKLDISGDTYSFILLDNESPFILQPNETRYVKVRFHPRFSGIVNGKLNIYSNYSSAPKIGVPLYGIGGEDAVIVINPMVMDFGVLKPGQTKDSIIAITNQGSHDLNISERNIIGPNAMIFDLINPGSLPIIIKAGEMYFLNIRATGIVPVGSKTADLVILSTDPNSPQSGVNLLAQVKLSELHISVEKIDFDTVDIGYYQDTLIVLHNEGKERITVKDIAITGAYSLDFFLVNTPTDFMVEPGDTKILRLRFKPNNVGLRFAVMSIITDEAITPQTNIILTGVGRRPIADITVSAGLRDDDILDFLVVPVLETRSKILDLYNLSKHAELLIDSLYFDYIDKQPFSYVETLLPITIAARDVYSLELKFNPHDKVKSYVGILNVVYRVPIQPVTENQTIQVKVKGDVIFPQAIVHLNPVLKFNKTPLNQTQIALFEMTNRGVSYLKIDSMVIIGEDASEFTILNTNFPIIVENENFDVVQIRVSFAPKRIGTKDAFIVIYWNDLYQDVIVEIVAEGVQATDDVIGVRMLEDIPTEYNLSQNYPNPFNPTTKIQYSIIEAGNVKLSICNSVGQEIMQLVNQDQPIGKYVVDFNAKNLPSGIYFYRLQTGKFIETKKMMLLK